MYALAQSRVSTVSAFGLYWSPSSLQRGGRCRHLRSVHGPEEYSTTPHREQVPVQRTCDSAFRNRAEPDYSSRRFATCSQPHGHGRAAMSTGMNDWTAPDFLTHLNDDSPSAQTCASFLIVFPEYNFEDYADCGERLTTHGSRCRCSHGVSK